ncbi:MAG TPA: PP2C family protein-serine/threonine phosphatase [Candidatus Limnocylindrales bacterium]
MSGEGTSADAPSAAVQSSLRTALDRQEQEIAELRAELTALRRQYASELAVARQIQLSLMPAIAPAIPGSEIAMGYRAARVVGGDFYDVYALPSAAGDDAAPVVGIAVGDVTGKGVTAALMMAFVRAVMRSAAYNGAGPADTLARTNRVLRTDARTGLFLTAFAAQLDSATGILRYASAGHEPPLVVHGYSRKVTELRAGGMMIGLADDLRLVEHQIRLAPGEVVIVYTDGITDARDRFGRFFGERRFKHLLRADAGLGPAALVEATLERVAAFAGETPAADDITLVAIGRSPEGPSRAG